MSTDYIFRYAVFAAVSSTPQAREDKASLGDQIKTARAAGLQHGGIETAGPFVLDGYSRTGYVNLSDAIDDIPPLAEAIQAAEQNKYDVLIMDNIERMGDLAPMLSTLFKRHKKQLHSARQSGRVFDPSGYDPYSDEVQRYHDQRGGNHPKVQDQQTAQGLECRHPQTPGKWSAAVPGRMGLQPHRQEHTAGPERVCALCDRGQGLVPPGETLGLDRTAAHRRRRGPAKRETKGLACVVAPAYPAQSLLFRHRGHWAEARGRK